VKKVTDQKSPEVSVEIDLQACAGHGRCCLEAPTVFGYDDVENKAYVLDDADVCAHSDEVQAAAAACPEAAVIVHS